MFNDGRANSLPRLTKMFNFMCITSKVHFAVSPFHGVSILLSELTKKVIIQTSHVLSENSQAPR